jgi:hypothetical protein
MSFETISNEYNSILTQYQETYQNYISSLDTSNNSLFIIPNSSIDGQTAISSTQETSSDTCSSTCSATSSCTGAVFNATNNNCILGSGGTSVIKSPNTNAIVKSSLYYSYQLQQLNQQLLILNQQMMQMSSQRENTFQTSQQNIMQKEQILTQNYKVLIRDRSNLDYMIKQFQTLDQNAIDGSLVVTSNYYTYIALLFITILLVCLLIKLSVTSEQRGGGSNFTKEALFLLGLMVLFLILSYFLKNMNIYIFVSILVFAYIISRMKNKLNK